MKRDGVGRRRAGKIGKTRSTGAFGGTARKTGKILRVFDAFGGTFAVVRRLKTVKFALGVDAFSTEREFSFLIVERRRAI